MEISSTVNNFFNATSSFGSFDSVGGTGVALAIGAVALTTLALYCCCSGSSLKDREVDLAEDDLSALFETDGEQSFNVQPFPMPERIPVGSSYEFSPRPSIFGPGRAPMERKFNGPIPLRAPLKQREEPNPLRGHALRGSMLRPRSAPSLGRAPLVYREEHSPLRGPYVPFVARS